MGANALGIPERLAALRATIQKFHQRRAAYRALEANPDARPEDRERARALWKAWEREFGSLHEEVQAILLALERELYTVLRKPPGRVSDLRPKKPVGRAGKAGA